MVNSALFGTLAASLFADPALSESATYYTARWSGVEVPVRVLRTVRTADFRFESTVVRSDAITFKLPAALLVDDFGDVFAPSEGDTITDADGNSYTVQGAPSRIMRGAAWLVEAVSA